MADRIEITCRRIVDPDVGANTIQSKVIESRVTAVVYLGLEEQARGWVGDLFDEVAGKLGANSDFAEVFVVRGVNIE